MDEYLPPIVTKLKADLSDLIAGFAQARLAAKEFAKGIDDDLQSSLGRTGDLSGMSFTSHLRETTRSEMKKFEKDVEDILENEVAQQFSKGGNTAGVSFAEAMSGAMWPILIGLLLSIAPGLITMLGSIIALATGLVFVGLGAFLLKGEQILIDAGNHLKDTMKRVFTDAAQPLLVPLTTGLWIISNLIEELGPAFKEIFAGIAPGVIPLFQGIAGMFRDMMPGLKELAPVIAQVMTAFGQALPGLGKGFADLFSSLARSGPALVEGMKMLVGILSVTLTFLGWLIEKSGKLFLLWEKFAKIFAPINTDPLGEVSKGAEKAWNWLGRLFTSIGHWFADVGRSIASWATDTWNSVWGWTTRTGKAIGDWFVMVGHWFAELPGVIGRFLAAVPGAVSRAFWAAFDAVAYALGYVTAKIWKFGQDLPGIIVSAFSAMRTAANNWTSQMVIDVLAWFERMKVQIPIYLAGLIVAIYQWGIDTQQAMVAWGYGVWKTMTDWTSKTIIDVINWLYHLPQAALAVGQDTNSSLMKWFNNTGEWLRKAGQDLMWGFLRGIIDANQAVYDAIVRAMNRIKQGAKDALGIHSPSTVFAEMGRFSMEGFIQGLLGGQNDLGRAWAGMVPAGTPGVSLGQSGSAAGAALAASGGTGSGQTMVHAVFKIDGKAVLEAITPAAQERKMRSGTTGLD